MRWIRSIFSVLAGYVFFAVCSFSIFRFSGRPAHAEAPVLFMAVTGALGVMFAVLGGYVAAGLAGRSPLGHGVAVGLVLLAGATASLFSTLGHGGAIWSQAMAICLMAPGAAVGGWLRARRVFVVE